MEIVVEVTKNRFNQEKYVPVKEDGFYVVTIYDKETGKILKASAKRATVKEVIEKGRRHVYRYIRIQLPWYSTLRRYLGRRRKYELIIKVRKIEE